MKLSLRVRFWLFKVATNALVFLAIALMAFLTNKYIETVALFISFVWIRNAFGKTYHANLFWLCILISIIVFVIAILFVPDKNVSLFACILFGLVIDYIAYKYKDYQDNKNALFELTKPKPFSVDICTEEELIKRCKELHLSQENINLAIEFFIKKTKHKILAEQLCIDEQAVRNRKLRLKEKLNKLQ